MLLFELLVLANKSCPNFRSPSQNSFVKERGPCLAARGSLVGCDVERRYDDLVSCVD